jgi:hypothetical protein
MAELPDRNSEMKLYSSSSRMRLTLGMAKSSERELPWPPRKVANIELKLNITYYKSYRNTHQAN